CLAMRSSFFSTYPRNAGVTSTLAPVTLSCIAVSFGFDRLLTSASILLDDARLKAQFPWLRDIWQRCGVRPEFLHRTTAPQFGHRSMAFQRLLLSRAF